MCIAEEEEKKFRFCSTALYSFFLSIFSVSEIYSVRRSILIIGLCLALTGASPLRIDIETRGEELIDQSINRST